VAAFGPYLAAIADAAQMVRDNKAPDVSPGMPALLGLMQFMGKEEQALGNVATTAAAFWNSYQNPGNPQAEAALAKELASRGFEITPYYGAIRAYSNITQPNYRSAPHGVQGLGARSLADYQAMIPWANQSFPQGAARVPGITGGIGAELPVRVSQGSAPPVSGTAGGMPPLAVQEADRLSQSVPDFKPLTLPNNKIGTGTQQLTLSSGEYVDFAGYVGKARADAVGALVVKPEYQSASPFVQARMYKSAVTEADKDGEAQYLARGVIKSTDPALALQEAVLGFHVQASERDKAYWVALLDRAGKLTPEVAKAIDASQPLPLPGQSRPPTVEEYRRDAPLIAEYLSLPPYGTDSRPFGTPTDWAAVAAAHKQVGIRALDLERGGMAKDLATMRAENEVLRALPPGMQRNLFLNGTQLENPHRAQLARKNPTLSRYVSPTAPNEPSGAYTNFPNQP
jgi:hypothetical protein